MQLGLPFAPSGADRIAPIAPLAPTCFVRHRRARRYVLRVDADGRLRVTIPRGGSRREAEAFAQRHADWIARQRGRLAHDSPSVQDRRALREQASRELPARLLELAACHGLVVSRISVRNQRSRWGSCSRNAAISLNWRLIQAPPFVCDFIILHELAHLKEMNHSRRFWC